MNNQDPTLEEYKKWRITQILKPYLSDSRQKQMKNQLISLQAAKSWGKYQNNQQKNRIIQEFQYINQIKRIKEEDRMLMDLEHLLTIKGRQVGCLGSKLSINNLIDLMFNKRQSVTLQDLRTIEYNQISAKLIQSKIIQSNQYKLLCQKYKTVNPQNKSMQIQYASGRNQNRGKHQSQNHMEIQYKNQQLPSDKSIKISYQFSQQIILKIQNRVQDLKQRYNNTQILQIKLLQFMKQLLSNNAYIQVKQVQNLITKQERFQDNVQNYFKAMYDGLFYRLERQDGYQILMNIYERLMPIDAFQLDQRCRLSKFKQNIKNGLFIIGNTGVGKTTFIQSMLGYKQAKIRAGSETILQIVGQLNQQHKGLLASNCSQSVTTHLSAHSLKINNKIFQIIDTPGFEDTNGPLTDICHQITLENAYQSCANTAFVILLDLNSISTERSKQIKKTAQNIARRFSYQSLSELQQFIIIIFNNKHNIVKRHEIQSIVSKDIHQMFRLEQFTSQNNSKNKIALEFVAKNLSNNRHIFDPLQVKNVNQTRDLILNLKFNRKNKMTTNFQRRTKTAITITAKKLVQNVKHYASKNQITKVRFYYEQINRLHSRIPKDIENVKAQVDSIMEGKSKNLYNQIQLYFKEKTKKSLYDQGQFRKIKEKINQLVSLKQLKQVNTKIKAEKQIQDLMQQISNEFINIELQKLKLQDIHNISIFITKLYQQIKNYIPSILSQIQKKCSNILFQLQKQIKNNFTTHNIELYDNNMNKYQKYQCYYKWMAKQNPSIFNKASNLTSKSQLFELNMTYLNRFEQNIKLQIKDVLESLKDKTLDTKSKINNVQNYYFQLIKYETSKTLLIKQKLHKLQQTIVGQISKACQNICQSFKQFFQFQDNYSQRKEDINLYLNKINQIYNSTKIKNLQQIAKSFTENNIKTYKQQLLQFQNKIQFLISHFKQRKKLLSDNFSVQLKYKMQASFTFRFLIKEEIQNRIELKYKQFQRQMNIFFKNQISFIKDKTLQQINTQQYTLCLNSLEIYQSYAIISNQFAHNLQQMNNLIIIKLKQQNKRFENELIKRKFDTKQLLTVHFNKKFVIQVQNYIQKIYNPSKNAGLLARQDINDQSKNVFQEIKRIFLDVQDIIKRKDDIKFPSSMKDQIYSLKKQEIQLVICQIREYIDQICYIFSVINMITSQHKIIVQYLQLRYSPNQNEEENGITIMQMQTLIKQLLKNKINDISSLNSRSTVTKTNIQLFNNIKIQCQILKKLQRCLKIQNENYQPNKQNTLDLVIKEVNSKLATIQTKILARIDRAIDKINHKIINSIQAGKLYVELRKNAQISITRESNQNFQNYLEEIDLCISTNKKAMNQYKYRCDENALETQILPNLQDHIQQYNQFITHISNEHQNQSSIIKNLQQLIRYMIEKVQQQIQSKKSQIQKEIPKGEYDGIKNKIKKLQMYGKIVQKFKCKKNRQGNQHMQQDQENEEQNKYTFIVAQLNDKLEVERQRAESFLKQPLNIYNIQNLKAVFHKQTQFNQSQLKKKVKLFFDEQLQNFKCCELRDVQKNLYSLQDLLQKIPLSIQEQYAMRQKIKDAKKIKDNEEERQINALRQLKLTTVFEKKDIIVRYNTLSNRRTKQQILKKIKQFIRAIANNIKSTDNIAQKIKIFKEQQWLYDLSKNEKYANIIYLIKETEEQIVKDLSYIQNKNCGYIIDLLVEEGISETDHIKIIKDIFMLNNFSLQIMNNFYQKSKIKDVVNTFTQFSDTIINNFLFYCPISRKQKQKQQQINLQLLRKIFEKMLIYEHIITYGFGINVLNSHKAMEIQEQNQRSQRQLQLYNGEQNIKMQRQLQQNNGQEVNEEQIPQKSTLNKLVSNIVNEINLFKCQMFAKIKYCTQYLELFDFQKFLLANDLDNIAIEKTIVELKKYISELQNFSLLFTDKFADSSIINSNKVKQLKKDLNHKLQTYIEKQISKFGSCIDNLDQQITKQFSYLQILVYIIDQKNLSFLLIEKKQLNSNITALKKPKDILERCIIQTRYKITAFISEERNKLILFYQKQFVDLKYQLTQQNRKKTKQLAHINENMKQTIQKTKQVNTGLQEDCLIGKVLQVQNQFHAQKESCRTHYEEKKRQLQNKIQKIMHQVLHNYCKVLIKMKKLQIALETFKSQQDQCKQAIKNQLNQIQKLKITKEFSKELQLFQNCDQYIHSIKSDTSIFKFQSIAQFNQRTKAQDSKYVIQNLKTKLSKDLLYDQDIQQGEILKKFRQLQQSYKQIKECYKLKQKTVQEIIADINTSNQLHQLSTILAVWSINKSIIGNDDQSIYEIEPHPAQIVTIILLTQLEQGKKEIQSKLAEVKTGQGKSIILATLATYYAKKGHRVNLACYSAYLCQRDYRQFTFLFQQFNVQDKIVYGTFNQICELVLNNDRGNLKEIIKNYLTQQQGSLTKNIINSMKKGVENLMRQFKKNVVNLFGNSAQNSPSILLVDEVDVFFQKDYFGQLFRPVVRLDQQQFKNLLKFVWSQSQKNRFIQANQIYKSRQYNICIQKYPRVAKILKKQVHGMLNTIFNQNSCMSYQIHEGALKYRDKDRLSQSLHFGYETVFANCRQFQAGKICKDNYTKNLFVPIIIGEFSYSELPKQYFVIQGLSGTVMALSQSKDQVLLEKYKIKKQNIYKLPSIYGQNMKIVPKYHICGQKTFYKQICQQIALELSKQRPVLVCFQDYTALKKFEQSKQFITLNPMRSYLHQMQNDLMRDKAINGAGVKGRLTLMTSQFSRGTDIIVRDRNVKKNGGLALIMAYIPKSQSQFEQFKGRTGRQGNTGSIEIFFNKDQFQQYLNDKNISLRIPERDQSIIQALKAYWRILDELQMSEKKSQIKCAEQKHKKTIQCLQMIDKTDKQEQLLKYIDELNNCKARKSKVFNILFGIDGTGSMGHLFTQLKEQLTKILARINQLKRQIDVDSEFRIQLAIYRNYSSGQQVFQVSNRQIQATNLIQFLNSKSTGGGQGNEALQVLFRYINIKEDVDMVIILGDAPPNTEQQIISNRKRENWVNFQNDRDQYDKQFFQIKSNHDQYNKFKPQFVVHGLMTIKENRLSARNKQFQQYLSALTKKFNGQSKTLNFLNPSSSQILIKFITTKITCLISGSKNVAAIQEIYQRKFKSYA